MTILKQCAVYLSMAVFPGSAYCSEYVSYSGPDYFSGGAVTYRIDIDDNRTVSMDAIESAEFCEKKSGVYCFSDGAVSFSIPKNGVSTGQKWSYKGHEFTAARFQEMVFLGRRIPVVVVTALSDSGQTNVFYFSRKLGIIALKLSASGKTTGGCDYGNLFVLKDAKGFPFN